MKERALVVVDWFVNNGRGRIPAKYLQNIKPGLS